MRSNELSGPVVHEDDVGDIHTHGRTRYSVLDVFRDPRACFLRLSLKRVAATIQYWIDQFCRICWKCPPKLCLSTNGRLTRSVRVRDMAGKEGCDPFSIRLPRCRCIRQPLQVMGHMLLQGFVLFDACWCIALCKADRFALLIDVQQTELRIAVHGRFQLLQIGFELVEGILSLLHI